MASNQGCLRENDLSDRDGPDRFQADVLEDTVFPLQWHGAIHGLGKKGDALASSTRDSSIPGRIASQRPNLPGRLDCSESFALQEKGLV